MVVVGKTREVNMSNPIISKHKYDNKPLRYGNFRQEFASAILDEPYDPESQEHNDRLELEYRRYLFDLYEVGIDS